MASYVQFACFWQLNSRENCMCGRQLRAKFASAGGYNTAKPQVFCNDAGKTNL